LYDELWKNSENKIWTLLNEEHFILVRTTMKRISTYFLGTCILHNNVYIHVENKICLYLETISKGFGVLIPMWRERNGEANIQASCLTAKQIS